MLAKAEMHPVESPGSKEGENFYYSFNFQMVDVNKKLV